MANGKSITNDKLYDSLNSMRLELKGDIRDLRNQFDTLEAGRLTRLESKMADFEVGQARRDSQMKENQATLSTKFVVLGTIGLAILYGLANALALKLINHR